LQGSRVYLFARWQPDRDHALMFFVVPMVSGM
jgi:hypothetical protein